MTAQPARSRRLARVGCGLAIAATLAASGCAAGQHAQTADEKPTLDGTEASVGQLDLRGIAIAAPGSSTSYAPGASALLHLTVVNNGQRTDRLTSITSSAFSGWGSYSSTSAAQAALAPSSSAATSSSATPAPTSSASSSSTSPSRSRKSSSSTSTTPSSTPSSTTPAAPSSTSSAAPAPSRSVAISAGSATSWGTPDSQLRLVLSGIRQRLFAAAVIKLTFTFADAGTVTVPVPVELTSTPPTSVVPEPANPSGSATG